MSGMKKFPVASLLLIGGGLVALVVGMACVEAEPTSAARPSGELIYVPIYSKIFYDDGKSTIELSATLSVHNVNVDREITLVRVDYHDTQGKLLTKYVDKAFVLKPLETRQFVIEKTNTAGGLGANFLVEWSASGQSNSPLVEALMVNAGHNLGIAFTSPGKVIEPSATVTRQQ